VIVLTKGRHERGEAKRPGFNQINFAVPVQIELAHVHHNTSSRSKPPSISRLRHLMRLLLHFSPCRR